MIKALHLGVRYHRAKIKVSSQNLIVYNFASASARWNIFDIWYYEVYSFPAYYFGILSTSIGDNFLQLDSITHKSSLQRQVGYGLTTYDSEKKQAVIGFDMGGTFRLNFINSLGFWCIIFELWTLLSFLNCITLRLSVAITVLEFVSQY